MEKPLTNEERLELENKQLRASIEIYAQQCMELSRFARKYEQLENQMQELQELRHKMEGLLELRNRIFDMEHKLDKLEESKQLEDD